MDSLLHMISLASSSAAGVLISAIWEGVVLTVCVALSLRMLPSLGAAARSAVWTSVFFLLILLHFLPFLSTSSAAGELHHSAFQLDPRWAVAIAGIWLLLSVWRGVQLSSGAIRSHALAARAKPICNDEALKAMARVRDRSKPGRKVEICTSAEVERPSVFGFFRPRILLPLGMIEQFTPMDLEQVVLHELEHLRRRDDWTNLLQKLGLVLFPLNPAMLWVERRLCSERELACDDCVLRSTGARKAYAICLTRLAEYSMIRRNLLLALGAWERRSELASRIHRILRRQNNRMDSRRAATATAALIAAVLAGAVSLARSPQFLSFAPPVQISLQARSVAASGFQTPNLQQVSAPELRGSPELVKAVMPQRRLQTKAQLQESTANRPTAERRSVPPPIVTQPATLVVLTGWEDSGPPPRLVIAVSPDRRASFAAVATVNGWLIVQI